METAACPVFHWAQHAPLRLAAECGDERWTYQRLDAEVGAWEQVLRRQGVVSGSRFAMLSWNSLTFLALFHAAARIGAGIAPLNARLTAPELSVIRDRLQPAVVFAEPGLAHLIDGAVALDTVQLPSASLAEPKIELAAVHALVFTSGTTGQAKAAQLTVGNFIAHAKATNARLPSTPNDRWLASLPFFHIGGLAMIARSALAGNTLVVQPRFDPLNANTAIDEQGITHLSLVATSLKRLLEIREERPFPSSLNTLLVGGGPVPSSVLARARSLGVTALRTYGLTEACSQVCTETATDAGSDTCGPPLNGVEVRVVDSARVTLAVGEIGEIEVRGPTVMAGYLDAPEANAQVLSHGWLRTGDFGSLDADSRLTVFARRSDLIVSGGENIYPAEIEAVLEAHPSILEAAVVPLADAEWGQVPVALVVVKGTLEPVPLFEALDAFCRQQLAGFKIPKVFRQVSTLPRTSMGKLDRVAMTRLLARPG